MPATDLTRAAPAVVHFDGWILRTQSGELEKNGTRVRLQGHPLQLLEELLAKPGELTTREQLIARLWPKGVVDFDTALNSTVRRLRAALGDEAETPRYIETIPRRGYRFIGTLEAPAISPATPTIAPSGGVAADPTPHAEVERAPWWRGRALAIGLLSIVVLPFVDLSPQQDPVTTNAQAYELFLRGRFFLQRRASGDIERAADYFERALALDPRFARGWAALGSARWLQIVDEGAPAEPGLQRVREAAERALALDPRNAEAHIRLANYWSYVGDTATGNEHMLKAAELEPNSPLVLMFMASDAASKGRFDEAIRLQKRAIETDPLAVVNRRNMTDLLYLSGRFAQAKAEWKSVLELDPTQPPDVLANILLVEGQFDEALTLIEDIRKGAQRHRFLALAYHGLGRQAEADAELQQLIGASERDDPAPIAEVYAFRGEKDQAFKWLNAVHAPERNVDVSLSWVARHSPFLKTLHADPRWDAWVASIER